MPTTAAARSPGTGARFHGITVDNAGELLDLVANLEVQTSGSEPPRRPIGKAEDLDVAARFAPVIRFDEAEPFMPLAVGLHHPEA